MEPLLNMDAAAKLLGLTCTQLYELCRNRSQARQLHPIPKIRLGKRIMFRASSLEAWLGKLEDAVTNGKGMLKK